ncbi:MAG: trypsin-like peptidase domain-containing protein, partial [Chthoniobacterales bacterium]
MKNLLKFLLFVGLLSAGISALYDYRLKRGGLDLGGRRTPEKYTLASAASVEPKEVSTLDALSRERRALVNSVIPSVVSIRTSKKVPLRRQYGMDPFEFFYRNSRQYRNPHEEAMVQNSLGSGVIVSAEGHVITNNHVVDQVDEIEIQLHDGRTKQARLVGADAQVDLAVLKVDEPNVKPLKFGDSDAVQAGDFVLAIGNPFGFEETVTDGIISSKGRPNRVDGFGDFLQTNAAINPGNSGGPLINLRGEIVGINTAIISRSGGSQGIGFAIPSNSVRSALESLLKQGRIIRGYLGIQMRTPQPGQPEPDTDGVVVEDVIPGSPAAEARLQRGDIIRKFNGREIKSFPELRSLVSQAELGKKVELEVVRNGKPMTVATEIK